MNKPENTMPWETQPSSFSSGWTAVGYIVRGTQCGTFVPVHHWHDRRMAEAHEFALNRGLSREEAKAHVMALVHKEVEQ